MKLKILFIFLALVSVLFSALSEKETKLFEATLEGNYSLAEKLIAKKVNVNAQDEIGLTPLMIASAWGDVKFVELFLKAKADKEIKSYEGKRAIDYAGENGFDKIVDLLM